MFTPGIIGGKEHHKIHVCNNLVLSTIKGRQLRATEGTSVTAGPLTRYYYYSPYC